MTISNLSRVAAFALALVSAAPSFASGADATRETSPVVPFLVPNGRPDEAECRRLVAALAEAGFDQVLLYPATGLGYEYLGEDYFKMIATLLDELRRREMKAWLYDEFNWPSGSAYGRVPAEDPRFLYRELVAFENGPDSLGWTNLESRTFNVDNGRLDTNNFEPDGVRRFMDLTHREYERRFRPLFGSVIRGLFSDEPGSCSSARAMAMPPGTVLRLPAWSGMEDEYRRATGGDFRADYARARREGRDSIAKFLATWVELRSKRYRRSFFDPIAAWCESLGIESTGHVISEDYPAECGRVNGLPLDTFRGLSKPGIDLIYSNVEDLWRYEWITLAFAQAGARMRGKPGAVELFACGPCDLDFTRMREMYYLAALHHVDTFFATLCHHKAYRFNEKGSYAMFFSPSQPWFDEMPLLHDAARDAARWARKPFKCEIAVTYPQRLATSRVMAGLPGPAPEVFARHLTLNQFTYDLVAEDERTAHPVRFDWDGVELVERSGGTRFGTDFAAAIRFLETRFPNRPRVTDATGATRAGFVTRAYLDGSALAVNVATGEILVAPDGKFQPAAKAAPRAERSLASDWELALSRPNRRRTWFWTSHVTREANSFTTDAPTAIRDESQRHPRDNMAKVTLPTPLKGIRLALRAYPADLRLAVTLDGRALAFTNQCASIDSAYDDLYRETKPLDLAAGEHVFELSGGNDGKLFLPAMWMVGDFAEKGDCVLEPLPARVPLGSLESLGLGSFAGAVTYRAEVEFAPGERLAVDPGGAVTRVKLGGRDLGARGWAPFEWEIPSDLSGRKLPLEITLKTSIRPIFGDETAPDAKLDHSLWTASQTTRHTLGLRAASAVKAEAAAR